MFTKAGNAIKHLVDAAPRHLGLLLAELSGHISELAGGSASLIRAALSPPSGEAFDPNSPGMVTVGSQGSSILRIFHLLQVRFEKGNGHSS